MGVTALVDEAEAYRRDGYVALPALFPVEVLHAFYARLQDDLKAAGTSLRQFTTRGPLLRHDAIEIYAHQYAPMLALLWGLTPRMALVAGCELLPTYAYLRLYRRGDICRVHGDRHACEHSLSLTIAYAEDRPWALSVGARRLDRPGPATTEDFGTEPYGSVPMHPGDAVAYQGTHHRHGRLEPNPNSWSAHLFLHWVDRAGPYADQAFDRPALASVRQAAASTVTTRR